MSGNVGRPKKNGKHVNCYVREDIANALEELTIKTGLPKTTVVEKALIEYIERYKKTGKI